MVAFYALVIGLAGLIFFYIGVSMGWLYVSLLKLRSSAHIDNNPSQTFMGVILGSAVVPIALCITWSKANKWGCIYGAISGFWAGIIAWLVTTSTLNNKVINVTVRFSFCHLKFNIRFLTNFVNQTSGGDFEMLAGNLASIGVGGIVAVVWSLIVRPLFGPVPYFSCIVPFFFHVVPRKL